MKICQFEQNTKFNEKKTKTWMRIINLNKIFRQRSHYVVHIFRTELSRDNFMLNFPNWPHEFSTLFRAAGVPRLVENNSVYLATERIIGGKAREENSRGKTRRFSAPRWKRRLWRFAG